MALTKVLHWRDKEWRCRMRVLPIGNLSLAHPVRLRQIFYTEGEPAASSVTCRILSLPKPLTGQNTEKQPIALRAI